MKVAFTFIFIAAMMYTSVSAQTLEDGLYYSSKMVKNGTFTWTITENINEIDDVDVYSDLQLGANFTVRLRDNLYPGPITEEELNSVYATIEVDGEKYTGSGFPLFWHVEKVEDGNATTIREEFEAETDLFNVTDAGTNFYVNFTVPDVFEVEGTNYTLFVEMVINPTDGLTVRYYDELYNVTTEKNTFEMVYIDYVVSAPMNTLWGILGIVSVACLVWFVKKKKHR